MDTPRDPPASCGFCDGSGVWADPDRGPTAYDPCPHCDGSGTGPRTSTGAARADEDRPPLEPQLPAVLAALPRLSPGERQRVYEELHARFDCRIYRS